MSIVDLENTVKSLETTVSAMSGQKTLLSEQIKDQSAIIEECKAEKEKYQKAVEIVNHIQKQTQGNIKETFESIVTYALKYIYSDHYEFGLEFDRRGNLGTMNFNIKTEDFQEASEPTDTSGGGVLDICALALRMVLLEVSYPKVEGTLILDESFKHLSSDYLENGYKFLQEINKKLKRQIIMITHKQEIINDAENKIEII